MQIEHDPTEPKIDRSNTIFWVAWALVVFGWLSLLFGGYRFDWPSVALGGFTIGVLIIHVTEKTGNKLPDWWR